jgi:hypothetical protein
MTVKITAEVTEKIKVPPSTFPSESAILIPSMKATMNK